MNTKMKAERIVITGGAGFIGSNLIAKLVKNKVAIHLLLKQSTDQWRIANYVNTKKVFVHYLDLMDAAALKKIVTQIEPTIIYHLAAHGATHAQNDPQKILESDLFGTLNLLIACEPIQYKLFVNIGSSSEYGFSDVPMSEAMQLQPNSYYAVAKAAQTQLARYVAQSQKKPIITIRLFSVYGPYESHQKLFPSLFKAISNHTTIEMGNKASAHDFVYVDDVIEGLLKIDTFSKLSGEIYNFGSGTQITLQQVIKISETVTGQPILVNWQNTATHRWDTSHWVAATTKVKQVITWEPRNFRQGLEIYWDWFREHQSLYAKMI